MFDYLKLVNEYKKSSIDFREDIVGKYHSMRIFASKFHQTYPNLFLTGGWDDNLKVQDTVLTRSNPKKILSFFLKKDLGRASQGWLRENNKRTTHLW